MFLIIFTLQNVTKLREEFLGYYLFYKNRSFCTHFFAFFTHKHLEEIPLIHSFKLFFLAQYGYYLFISLHLNIYHLLRVKLCGGYMHIVGDSFYLIL